MILHFNENINADSLSKVIDFTNQLIENERYGIIYLNSNGGSSMHKDAILDIINVNSKLFKLVGYGRLCSAAFDLFFSAKCDRKLVDGTLKHWRRQGIVAQMFNYLPMLNRITNVQN